MEREENTSAFNLAHLIQQNPKNEGEVREIDLTFSLPPVQNSFSYFHSFSCLTVCLLSLTYVEQLTN